MPDRTNEIANGSGRQPLPGLDDVLSLLDRKGQDFSDADLECLEAIRHAIDAATTRIPTSEREMTQQSFTKGLTPRETDVVALLREGLTDRQIALRLTISPRTVAKHLEHVYLKTGLRTRTQVMAAHRQMATSDFN